MLEVERHCPSFSKSAVFTNTHLLFFPTQQASPRVQVDEDSVTKLAEKLQKDDPTPEIFDEVQRNVCFPCIRGSVMNPTNTVRYDISFSCSFCIGKMFFCFILFSILLLSCFCGVFLGFFLCAIFPLFNTHRWTFTPGVWNDATRWALLPLLQAESSICPNAGRAWHVERAKLPRIWWWRWRVFQRVPHRKH